MKKLKITDAFLHGKMVLTINQYNKTQAYQNVVPISETQAGTQTFT